MIIDYDDFKKIGKFYNAKIIKFIGPKGFISIINYLKANIIVFVCIVFFIFLYTRIIINIDVLSNNKELYDLIFNELDKENVSKYSFLKNDTVLEQIENNILKRNKDKLEWLNIRRVGMKYIINLEPKIDKDIVDNSEYCHIVSLKDAMITKIYSSQGVELKEINETVKKGDILISGDIKKEEEVKGNVCASGTVYGNTWYTINIEVPKMYDKKELLDNKRFNVYFKYNNKSSKLFKSRFANYEVKLNRILNIFGLEIYYGKEVETEFQQVNYNDEELDKKIDELINEKMKNVLNEDGSVKSKKVLKKVDNNSTIYLEIFIVAEEKISNRVVATIQTENG